MLYIRICSILEVIPVNEFYYDMAVTSDKICHEYSYWFCSYYGRTLLLWMPREPGNESVLCREVSLSQESLYCEHLGNLMKCPV